jgi:uncharacterized phage-associated protein
MAHSALSIARYFISLQDEDAGDTISNLKLQKLLYYAQGYYVGLHGAGDPLFRDIIYAWKHGPVVKSVYNHYAHYGAQAIPHEEAPRLDSETVKFLDEIYRVYGRFSAWALRQMTHEEEPWKKHYDPDIKNVEIPKTSLASFFKKNVKKK